MGFDRIRIVGKQMGTFLDTVSVLELSSPAPANSLCWARKAGKPGTEQASIAPEPESISISKAARGVAVLSRAGGSLLHGWSCS